MDKPTNKQFDADYFQRIYETTNWYGNARRGRCPSVRLLPSYKSYLKGKIVEFGCGRGQLVEKLKAEGYDCQGYDQIDLDNAMHVADITEDIDVQGDVAICIDCIEHIYDHDLLGLFENMKKFSTQIMSIHNGKSMHKGVELHINKKPFAAWREFIKAAGFEVIVEHLIHKHQILLVTKYND